jgi:hypothetical protein
METRIKRLPVIGSAIKKWDCDIQQYGIPQAMLNLLYRFNTRVEVDCSNETAAILRNGSGLLVSNHPKYVEPIPLFAALPNRTDFYLMGNTLWKNLSDGFDKQLLPVYVRHHMFDEGNQLFLKILEYLHYYPALSPSQEEIANFVSLRNTSRLINKGGIVGVFPLAGSRIHGDFNEEWFPGVGIIANLLDQPEQKHLINCHISGTSSRDVLRALPVAGKLLPDFKVRLSAAMKINSILSNNARATTQNMQSQYQDWVRTAN